MCVGVIGRNAQHPPMALLRFDEIASVPRGEAEVVVGVRVVRLELDGLLEVLEGFVPAAELAQRHAHIVAEFRTALVRGDRLADQVDGNFVAPDLQRDHAEKVQAVDVLGIDRKNVAIKAFGFRQSSCLVQRHRALEVLMQVEAHRERLSKVGFIAGAQARALDKAATP